MALKQDQRIGNLNTPLGKDVLSFARLSASEGLSELFHYRIDAFSDDPDLDFSSAIGKQCTLTLKTHGKERQFNGVLTRAEWLGRRLDIHHYRLVLRPWLWLLSRASDCRIFQDKKAPEIIQEVFQDHGLSDFELKLTAEYPKIEYCVQFRETDLNFVSRLMEQHGIYYFFKHEGGKHTLVLADSSMSHTPVPGQPEIPYVPLSRVTAGDGERIIDWTTERRFRTTKVELKDYNYQTPNATMKSEGQGRQKYGPELSFYDFPGKYKDKSDGDFYAKVQIESEQAEDFRRFGEGDALSLFPGGLTTLQRHEQSSQNKKYLIVRCTHNFETQVYRSQTGAAPAADERLESGSYEFFPSELPFRAPIMTPKPKVYGIQTAKVVTKDDGSSEEIDVEKLTEIYVRFYWDRKDKRSCKLRVAQVWSGKAWGGQIIPRVGQEVVVEFLEGDPDRPLIVGTVYNDEYKPPYELPKQKNIGGLKSDSTKGSKGYNEWNFDDTKGSEAIGIHAQKDLNIEIRHAETRKIGEDYGSGDSRKTDLINGGDRLNIANGDQTIDISNDQTVNVGRNITIVANQTIQLIVGKSTITLDQKGVTIDAPTVTINSMALMTISGLPVKIN